MAEESHELILTESGTPFKTENAALATMARKKLSGDDYRVVPVEGGFAIDRYENAAPDDKEIKPKPKPPVVSPTGREKTYLSVFDSHDDAVAFVKAQNVGSAFENAVKYVPLTEGGFRLELPRWWFFTKEDAEAFKRDGQMPEKMVKIVELPGGGWKIVERHWRVTFNQRTNPYEEEQVVLAVQGETLTCQREKPVIMPERFLEAADHTKYPKHIQIPGESRKRTVYVQTFTYQRLEEVTEEDFFAQKKAGTEKTKRDVVRFGFDVDPAMLEDGGP